ncbi:MAG: hypothetical protein AB7G80_09610 [Dongiaceae bacterium]
MTAKTKPASQKLASTPFLPPAQILPERPPLSSMTSVRWFPYIPAAAARNKKRGGRESR